MSDADTRPLEPRKGRPLKIIDFQIPLVWLLSCAGGLALLLISMWFSLQTLVRDVGDLQVAVKSWNVQAASLATDLAILRLRVENLEAQVKGR